MGIIYHLFRWVFISGCIALLVFSCMALRWETMAIILLAIEILWTVWACISMLNWMKSKLK